MEGLGKILSPPGLPEISVFSSAIGFDDGAFGIIGSSCRRPGLELLRV